MIVIKDNEFHDVLMKLGKLAFKTLLSGNPLLGRSQVIKDVGPEAFDYGLLIGHEDFRLIRDETADIFVTFLHRSLQEFLGAFYFILMLNEGESVESLLGSDCKEPIFMMNPLFLHFCLCLLDPSEDFFTLENRQASYGNLTMYTATAIDTVYFDLKEISKIFPVFDMSKMKKDELVLRFLLNVLSLCHKPKELYFTPDIPAVQILLSMSSLLSSNKVIGNTELDLSILDKGSNGLLVVDTSRNYMGFIDFLEAYMDDGRHPSLYLCIQDETDISRYCSKYLKKLCLYGQKHNKIMIYDDIQHCPFLTELNFVRLQIHESVPAVLCKAMLEGKLPKLTCLTFVECIQGLKGKLSIIISLQCNALTRIDLRGCNLEDTDKVDLSKHEKILLPMQISCLDLSHSSGVKGQLSKLLGNRLPALNTLNLSSCGLDEQDIRSIVEAINKYRLPALKYLDLSKTEIVGDLLFKLPFWGVFRLKCLNLSQCGLKSFPALTHLNTLEVLNISENRISEWPSVDFLGIRAVNWLRIQI